jgi:hypothetical protein
VADVRTEVNKEGYRKGNNEADDCARVREIFQKTENIGFHRININKAAGACCYLILELRI